ncbi:MAG: hypothetical protein MK105_12910 [Crocinitomicaceae bacterium]|nr:hypothetical protein [Crocinitomicaceae bacterium]
MNLNTIYLKPGSEFSTYITSWALKLGIQTADYDFKAEELGAEGLLLINENQDIEKEIDDLHNQFYKKHYPTQKIDINGTLQVAVSNFDIWMKSFKCKEILILGSDNLVKNDNLERFFNKLESNSLS